MSIDLTLQRVHSTYRLDGGHGATAGRRHELDTALERLLRRDLPAALEQLGLSASTIVCIRRLEVHLDVDAELSPAQLERHWTDAIVSALTQRLARPDDDVRLYPSLETVRAEVITSTLRNDLTGLWAWRQSGAVPPDTSSTSALLGSTLASDPRTFAPVLAAIRHTAGRQAALAALDTVGIGYAIEITRRHLAAVASPVSFHDIVRAIRSGGDPLTPTTEASPPTTRHPLQTPADPDEPDHTTHTLHVRSTPTTTRRTAETLAVEAITELLAEDPLAFARGSASDVLAKVQARARQLTPSERAPRHRQHPRLLGGDQMSTAGSDLDAHGPTPNPQQTADDQVPHRRHTDQTLAHTRRGVAADRTDPDHPMASPIETSSARGEDTVPPPRSETHASLPRPRSAVAGLFFLIPVIRPLDVVPRLAADPTLAEHSTRWILRWLGCALTGVPDHDPAVLGFCGIDPREHQATLRSEALPSLAELDPIHRAAADVADRLADVLDRHDEPARQTVADVVERPGRLDVAPGWIEIEFETDEIDLDVRRAGLDLDPGFVAWIGSVVRYRYV